MLYYKGGLRIVLGPNHGSKNVSEKEHYGESTEMYLKTIRELTSNTELIPISQLAERLGISNVSATEMVHRMEDRNLVEHQPYKGIRLTESGSKQAKQVVRRHRLWECFLTDELGLPWEDVHDLACDLEHASDPRVTEALAELLGKPKTCPHGNPIPDTNGHCEDLRGQPLEQLSEGQRATLVRVHPESNALLAYLASHGLLPGSELQIIEVNRFDRLWTLQVGNSQEMISNSIAKRMLVEPQTAAGKV